MGEEEGSGVRSGPGEARTILLNALSGDTAPGERESVCVCKERESERASERERERENL